MKKEMWKSSAEKLKSVRWLAVMAIFLALRIVVSRFSIPVGVNLYFSFDFLINAICGMVLGPAAGIVFAVVEDIMSYMLFPDGYGFFAGYILTAALGILCYAVCMYDQKQSVLKIAIAKAVSSFGINVMLGSYWTYVLTGGSKAYLYYAGKSLFKNAVLYPFQVLAIVLLVNLLIPYLSRHHFIKAQKSPMSFIA